MEVHFVRWTQVIYNHKKKSKILCEIVWSSFLVHSSFPLSLYYWEVQRTPQNSSSSRNPLTKDVAAVFFRVLGKGRKPKRTTLTTPVTPFRRPCQLKSKIPSPPMRLRPDQSSCTSSQCTGKLDLCKEFRLVLLIRGP